MRSTRKFAVNLRSNILLFKHRDRPFQVIGMLQIAGLIRRAYLAGSGTTSLVFSASGRQACVYHKTPRAIVLDCIHSQHLGDSSNSKAQITVTRSFEHRKVHTYERALGDHAKRESPQSSVDGADREGQIASRQGGSQPIRMGMRGP